MTAGVVHTSDRTVGVIRDMDEAVDILTPADVPIQQVLANEGTNVTKVEWMEEELQPQTVTWTSKTGTGPWTVTAPSTADLRVGDILWPRNGTNSAVQFLVTSITNATTFVCAGFDGNTTSATDLDVMEIIGQLPTEGGAPQSARSNERTENYNYTQILQEAVHATRTARHRGQRGGMYSDNQDPYERDLSKKFSEINIRFERALLHGRRYQSGDTRFMGGLFQFVTTNNTSGVKANITTLLNDAIRAGYDNGGSGKYALFVSPTVKSLISAVDSSQRRTTRTETRAGYVVDTFESDFGEVMIVPNRHLPRTRGIVLQTEYTKVRTFDAWAHEPLAKTGDADLGQVVGEKSLEVKNEKASGLFTITDA